MGSYSNFGDIPAATGEYPLARQSSIYSLTFDEFQNSMGGSLGKDFGSINMDELLKNIWSAEETQMLATNVASGTGNGGLVNRNLQRQGSITLPRTLSQKTVDEVWRGFSRESDGARESNNGVSDVSNLPQRQQTLGEMTLEEFLVIAGVVREEAQAQAQPIERPNNNDLAFGFQNQVQNSGIFENRVMQMNNSALSLPQSSPLMSFSGVRSAQPDVQPRQKPLFAKPATTVAFSTPMHLVSNAQLTSAATREGNQVMAGITGSNVRLSPCGGLGDRAVTVAAVSPTSHLSPELVPKTCMDSPSSVSPVPYMFARRGKCSAQLEKVIERRQKRMIKNRESAARSRARKQAYTLELEAEIAKLKEVNEELHRKQEEFMESQKNQILETLNQPCTGNKRQCLRRTHTGPW